MSHLAPCPGCNRHVLTIETACPFCALELPASFRALAPPPPQRGRLGRAALLVAGAALMGAGACSNDNGGGTTDGSGEGPPLSDGSPESGSGGAGGVTAGDGAAGGAPGSGGATQDAASDRGAVALYGLANPDAAGTPIYGAPSPNRPAQS
jgi:hypothetical protein